MGCKDAGDCGHTAEEAPGAMRSGIRRFGRRRSRGGYGRPTILFVVLVTLALPGLGCAEGGAHSGRGDAVGRRSSAKSFCGDGRQFRSPRSGPAVHLELDRQHFVAGQALYYRIVNERARAIAFGFDPRVERFGPGGWTRLRITENGAPVLFASPAIVLRGAPARSACQRVPLSATWPAGRYRVRQPVRVRSGSAHSKKLMVVAEFFVG